MQLLQLLRGLLIAVSKTIPQSYLLTIRRNQFQGNPFQTVFFHSLFSRFFAHSAIFLFAYKNRCHKGWHSFHWNHKMTSWTLLCLLCFIPETDAASSLFLQQTWNPLRRWCPKISSFSIGVPSLDFLAAHIFWWRKHETDGIIENKYILLDVLLCSIAEYFYELCRILTSP